MYSTAPAATVSASMSLGRSSDETPRKVFIVRCASGVTTMMHRPVGTPSAGFPGRKRTPTARRSWPNT